MHSQLNIKNNYVSMNDTNSTYQNITWYHNISYLFQFYLVYILWRVQYQLLWHTYYLLMAHITQFALMEIILKPFILQIVLSGWNGHSKKIKSKYSYIIDSVLIMPNICFITAMKCGENTYENKLYMLQKKTQ